MPTTTEDLQKAFALPEEQIAKIADNIKVFMGQAHRLHISPHPIRPPTIFLTIDEEELGSSFSENLFVVEIRRNGDNKTARLSLSVSLHDDDTITGRLTAQKRGSDPNKIINATYVDWDKVGK